MTAADEALTQALFLQLAAGMQLALALSAENAARAEIGTALISYGPAGPEALKARADWATARAARLEAAAQLEELSTEMDAALAAAAMEERH